MPCINYNKYVRIRLSVCCNTSRIMPLTSMGYGPAFPWPCPHQKALGTGEWIRGLCFVSLTITLGIQITSDTGSPGYGLSPGLGYRGKNRTQILIIMIRIWVYYFSEVISVPFFKVLPVVVPIVLRCDRLKDP
jgi:hypothetical protein